MLEISGIDAGYGNVRVLRGVSLAVAPGEVLCVMGRNGAGKSTLLKAVLGLARVTAGSIRLGETELTGLPAHRIPRAGLGYVPQGRRLFAELTVAENLEIGLMTRRKGAATRDRVLDLFPRLRERLGQISGTLSGGEQQMLATARALCLEPSVLLLDEPTEGLQPSMIALIRETVTRLRAEGVAVVLVEQRIEAVLSIADRVAFLVNGEVAEVLPAAGLDPRAEVFARWVGV
ncbi:ABC transporter ATP-binding protein [Amaricoccus solimangrovi]|uniref:ABC transporter ATP-binding protein n=1 Tax=Amaricoccus solimangrovi TaxID=2589815 RepID=A0A501WZI1_9RHOB|nr:ABC transporter ATP-binding protein [Amaricoccus solimangrovi]TPE53167.1 ABC transporter ATP-binding protein [Amaricoccus solimangrovi]